MNESHPQFWRGWLWPHQRKIDMSMNRAQRTQRRFRVPLLTPRGATRGAIRAAAAEAPPRVAPFNPLRNRLLLDPVQAGARVNIAGNVFWVTKASGSDAVAEVQFVKGGTVSEAVPVSLGFKLFGVEFDYILVTNAAQAGKYLDVTYGTDPKAGAVEGDTV